MKPYSMFLHSEKPRSAETDEKKKTSEPKLWLFAKPKHPSAGDLFQFIEARQGIASSLLYQYDGSRFDLIGGIVEFAPSPRRRGKHL